MELQVVSFVLSLICVLTGHMTNGGRAFPVTSDRYVQRLFKGINSRLAWDYTNFLVDLAGQYSTCHRVGQSGSVNVLKKTPEGDTISGLTDYTLGSSTDAGSVTSYIETILSRWPLNKVFVEQISRADKFGCSVEPGCSGYITLTCLFTPGFEDKADFLKDKSTQNAKAFTGEQYRLSEGIMGKNWDQSHLLENMSGYEIDCGMVTRKYWDFRKAHKKGRKYGLSVTGRFGSAPNYGNTESAIENILRSWQQKSGSQIGCSVIPDCQLPGQCNAMDVVVVCLFAK